MKNMKENLRHMEERMKKAKNSQREQSRNIQSNNECEYLAYKKHTHLQVEEFKVSSRKMKVSSHIDTLQ